MTGKIYKMVLFPASILFTITSISWSSPEAYSSSNFCLRQLSAKDRGAFEEVQRLKTKLEQLGERKKALDSELSPLLAMYPSLRLTKPPQLDILYNEKMAIESAIRTIEARIQILEGRFWEVDRPRAGLSIAYDLSGLESIESLQFIALLEDEFGVEFDVEVALESFRGIVTIEGLLPLVMEAMPRGYQQDELHQEDVVLRLQRFMEEGPLSERFGKLTGSSTRLTDYADADKKSQGAMSESI